jgi:hypothetical protein
MQHIFIKTFEVTHGDAAYQVAVLRGNKDESDSSITLCSLTAPGKTAVTDMQFADIPSRDNFFFAFDHPQAIKFMDDVLADD